MTDAAPLEADLVSGSEYMFVHSLQGGPGSSRRLAIVIWSIATAIYEIGGFARCGLGGLCEGYGTGEYADQRRAYRTYREKYSELLMWHIMAG